MNMTQIIHTTTNKNFDKALHYVKKRYPHLFHADLLAIELIETKENWLGLHTWYENKSKIKIRNGRYRVAEFIETLVHELVHCWQFTTDRDTNDKKKNRTRSEYNFTFSL